MYYGRFSVYLLSRCVVTSLTSALETASERWLAGPGGKVMYTMASVGVQALGPSLNAQSLMPTHGTTLIAALQRRGLSPKSVSSYYGAFKRLMALQGLACTGWPTPPAPPRVRAREPISHVDLGRLFQWFRDSGWPETADLGLFMWKTGGRVGREALRPGAMEITERAELFDTLRFVGKGGHERYVPLLDADVRELVADTERWSAVVAERYKVHLHRWNKGVLALGIKSKLATPHAARHTYASDTHRKSAGNLALVQQLLGHASVTTTSRYVHVSMEETVQALRSPTGEGGGL